MSDFYIEATPANMRKYGGEGVVALDQATGDTFSATPGDYFWLPDHEPLVGEEGEPLILVHEPTLRFNPLREAVTS